MRILVLLLLLANFGFWAYAHWIKVAPQPSERYEGPGIELLAELPADSPLRASPYPSALSPQGDGTGAGNDPSPAAAAVAEAEPAGGAQAESDGGTIASRCVVVGPFVESDDADAAAALLAGRDIAAAQFVQVSEIWDGYWVYIARIASRDAARRMLTELSNGGIDDAYMIPDSDSGILISLGVFSDITRAGAQASRVGRLGLEATIADRMRSAETTWLRMTLNDGTTDVPALLRKPGRIDRLEQRDCDAPAN